MPDQPEGVANDLVKELAEKAHDLDAVRKSVEDAAALSGTLWLSYLFALFYIGIAAGAVTQKELLLENAVKLPFLNVELPLVAFFALAPILFVISHAYTLMHFVLLAAKAGTFNAELEKKIPDPDAAPAEDISPERATELRETRLGLRRQLPSNIFVQFLAGPRDIRDGGLGWFLKAVAWISLVIGPVLLLLLLQTQFLPYHLAWVTWAQRFALLADVALLWFLWPAVLASRGAIQCPRLWWHPVLALLSLIPIGLAFTAATFPGEWMDEHIGNKQWIPPNAITAWLGLRQKDKQGNQILTSFHDLMFNGGVDDVTRRRISLFSNTLVLPSFDALEAAKIDAKNFDNGSIKHSLVLRGRHLEGAVFNGADLRKADLEGAKLQGAQLKGASLQAAQLQGASLENADLQGASLQGAHLEGGRLQNANLALARLENASLFGAQLQGASLENAHLQNASLFTAELQGASLKDANLHGAELVDAKLQCASLNEANLDGASLENAQFQGASLGKAWLKRAFLFGAELQGASLEHAQLQGASLENAQLQGASLDFAYLQGASLENADLQGASLENADLRGADFRESTLVGTDMSRARMWRTSFEQASLTAVFEDGLKESALSKKTFDTLLAKIWLKRIAILSPDIFGPEASERETLEKGRADKTAYKKSLADQLKSLACSGGKDAVHIVHGLLNNGRIWEAGANAPGLVEAIVHPKAAKDCPVSAALTEAEKTALKKLAKEASGAH